jgi:hypothetical protein
MSEIVEKVLYLRKIYRLGPIRIVWYLARYHAITISDAGVYRILRRNGLSRLLGGTRVRKIHTQRYLHCESARGSVDGRSHDVYL